MLAPQLVFFDSDGWMARQLAELARESRWRIRTPRAADSALSFVREPRPTVLFIRVELLEEKTDPYTLLAEVHRLHPDAATVAVSDVKLPEADRAAWTAVLFDLGARYVLFPPLSKPILEDVASGLMAAAIRQTTGNAASPGVPPLAEGEVIDLADAGWDE